MSIGRSPRKTVKIESELVEIRDFELSQEDNESISQFARATDPDAFKADWVDSAVYKRAMKAEAIIRGKPFSEYEFNEDDERVEMTQADAMSINEGSARKKVSQLFVNEESPIQSSHQVDIQDPWVQANNEAGGARDAREAFGKEQR